MCIVFWTLEHSDYALILCTNRDEFLDRPTLDAHFHSFGKGLPQDVLSGIDVLGGGSWFGVSRAGRVALLTNITEPPPLHPFEFSRGSLVSSHLLEDPRVPRDTPFAGFNLLLLVPRLSDEKVAFDAEFVSNGGAGKPISSRLGDATGGFSNAVDGEEVWPKVLQGNRDFARIVESRGEEEEDLVESLFGLLNEHPPERVVHRSELKRAIHVVPISIEGKMYGTRLSTVLLVGRDGRVLFVEQDVWKLDHDSGGVTRSGLESQRLHRFQLDVHPK
ncbi:NRDE protein-domain-containing protein [Desarmillaria ectypa]|nr:NRDE protein-domain-containing protein [Desarmillaria ectypa]